MRALPRRRRAPAARPPAAHARVSVSVCVADNRSGERGQKLRQDAAGDRVALPFLDVQQEDDESD